MRIERDGASLVYSTLGSGPDVVLLHPTPVHHEFWLPMARLLADRYRLILVDLRGHGKSGPGQSSHGQSMPGTGPITMERLAEDVRAILSAMGVARAAFVGCSIGAYLTYEYWRRFPGQISSMTLICGKPQPDTAANTEKRKEWMESVQRPGGLDAFFDLMADTLVGPTSRKRHPEIRDAARAMMNDVSLPAMLAVQQGLALRPDSVPALPTISVPVCAIAGGEDQGSTPSEMRAIAEQVPGAEFHLLEDAGHYAPMEQPDEIAAIVNDFLGGNFLDRQDHPTSARQGQA